MVRKIHDKFIAKTLLKKKKVGMSEWQLSLFRYHENNHELQKISCIIVRNRRPTRNLTCNPTSRVSTSVGIYSNGGHAQDDFGDTAQNNLGKSSFLFKHDTCHFNCFIVFPSDIIATNILGTIFMETNYLQSILNLTD